MSAWLQDLRHAARQLRKSPGFTIVAITTLAVGIGAATAVLSTARALVIDALPYPEPRQLVAIWTTRGQPLSTPDFLDLSAQSSTMSSTGAFVFRRINLGGEQAQSVEAVLCTPGLTRTLGVMPARGRWFDETDTSAETPRSVVISHALWQRHFGGSPAALGQTVRLNGEDAQVIGIMPQGFAFQTQRSGGRNLDVWVPLKLTLDEKERSSHWLLGLGRLKPGMTPEQADTDFKAIGARLTHEHPLSNQNKPFLARPLGLEITAGPASRLPILLAAVTLVLLMTCANVACMLLARGSHRQTEFGARLALGATRGAIIRLLLAESLLLAVGGTIVGSLLAYWSVDILRGALTLARGGGAAPQVDATLLLVAAGLIILTTLLAGLPPALTAARAGVFDALKASGRTQGASRMRRRFLRLLVAAQIMVALVLVNGSVLLSASYLNIWKTNSGLNTDRVLSAGISLAGERYGAEAARIQFWGRFLEQVRMIPGVSEAAMTTKLPLEGGNNGTVLVDGETYDPAARRPLVERSNVSPSYFSTMGIPLLQGQTTDPVVAPSSLVSVVVNRAFVEQYWRGHNPLGKHIRPNDAEPPWTAVVVGVVENVRQWGAEAPPNPEIYAPYALWPRPNTTLVIRSQVDPRQLLPALRSRLSTVDADLALAQVRTMDQVIGESTSSRRLLTQLINGFMLTAVLLALLGIYGTLSHNVARRTGEIGIRVILGAHRGEILALVYRQILPSIGAGLALGVTASLASIRFLRSFLVGVEAFDPLRLCLVTAAVGATLLLACWLPARRATTVSPGVALRCE